MFACYCTSSQAVAIWPKIITPACVCLSVCVTLLSSDPTVCERSPVQYPVCPLCEAGSQRDGEIAGLSSAGLRKQAQFVILLAVCLFMSWPVV